MLTRFRSKRGRAAWALRSCRTFGGGSDDGLGFAHHPREDVGGRREVPDQADAFAGEENRGLGVAGIARLPVARLLGRKHGGKLLLASMPGPRKAIGDRTAGI